MKAVEVLRLRCMSGLVAVELLRCGRDWGGRNRVIEVHSPSVCNNDQHVKREEGIGLGRCY